MDEAQTQTFMRLKSSEVGLRAGPQTEKKQLALKKRFGNKKSQKEIQTAAVGVLHRCHTNHDLSRARVLARVIPGQQSGAERGQAEAVPWMGPDLGGMEGAAGPHSGQRQPKRPRGHRWGASADLLHVLGFVITLNIPVKIDSPPAQEDVVHCCPLMDNQTCYNPNMEQATLLNVLKFTWTL